MRMMMLKKMTLVTCIGSVLLFALVLAFVSTSTRSALQRVMSERQFEVGRRIMSQIDWMLYEYSSDIQLIANDDAVQLAVAGEDEFGVFHEYAAEILQLDESWESLFAVDRSGRIHVSTERAGVNVNGGALVEGSPDFLAFQAAITGKPYYSNLVPLPDDAGAVLIFAAPIFDMTEGDRQIIGALLGHIPQSLFVDRIRDESSNSSFSLYSEFGALLATDQSGGNSEIFAVHEDIRNAIQNDTLSFTAQRDENSPESFITLTPSLGYLSYGGNRWVLAIETPTTMITFAVQNILGMVGIVLFLMLVGIVLYVLGLFRQFLGPINALSEAAEFVADGAFVDPLPVSGRDEASRLTSAFNAMMAELKKTYQSLNREVRTKSTLLLKKEKSEERSKAAILNLLEDIQEEKKHVEHTVVERTQELQAEKARLLASINSLSFGFIIATLDHRVVLVNQAMLGMFGVSQELRTVGDISAALGDRTMLEKQIEGCLSQKGSCEMKEIVFETKILRGVVAPVLAEHATSGKEEVSGYVFMLEDITEAKAVERSKDEFFAIASHELRTPLTAIRGNSEMMMDMYKEKPSDPEIPEMISDIHEASIRLIGIVNDFLDSSRLEQGKVVVQNENMDFLPIVEKTCHEINPLAQAKGLTLSYIAPQEKTLMVLADPARIKQAVSNLIDNAVKYSDKGTVTVSLSQKDGFAVLSVADTGKGIAPEYQSLLFRKFQQAGEAVLTRDVSKGTGLGLYISRLLMQAMGGSIGLKQSTLGVGSVFELTIPMTKV